MKKLLKIMFSRIMVVSLLILLQLMVVLVAAFRFTEYFVYYYLSATALALCLTLRIVNRKDAAEYKIAWLVTVLLIPVFGSLLYLIFSGNRLTAHTKKRMASITDVMERTLGGCETVASALEDENSCAAFQSRYIANVAHCPPFANTEAQYFPLGDDMFPVFLAELERAERYIFLEYFIIAEGRMWQSVLDILKRKAAAGVDVRLIYDDMGCIMLLPGNYAKRMRDLGIHCRVFNRFVPVLSARLNNRDHRKIGVIDGKVAFTGGVNLADEYINEKERFGHWKDNAVMLRGDAAWSMTVMFLTMWDNLEGAGSAASSYEHYRPQNYGVPVPGASGWIQPYTDNPLDNEPVGETIYLNMIHRAEKYVYITTPYLIIDELLENALCNAAKCGIDVRIITPGIGDKPLVYETTRSYYPNLIRNGVKIYEYTPGFIHAKTFICDDKYATVGTVNLDFRSLYLHFECGVWMYDADVIGDIRRDYIETMEKSRQVTLEDCRTSAVRGLFREVMALIAPMM
ncbi:MAG: cardiolipin synthase [Eubacteriales bacterium]